MKYIFFTLNIIIDLAGHFLMFLIWRYFFGFSSIYLQIAVGIILLCGVFLTVLAPLLVHWRDNMLSRALYLVVSLWPGIMLNSVLLAGLFFLISFLGLYPASAWTPFAKSLLLGVFPFLLLLPEAWLAQSTKIKKVSVSIAGLPESWQGKEIVHISDVHLGPIWRQRFFDRLVIKVNSLKAAAIFITGDLFDGMDADFSWFHQRKFIASAGVFYAFGNHDLILGETKVRNLLNNSNIKILGNEITELDGLQIVGLNCYYQGRLDVKGKILSQLGYDPARPSILMYHEPKDLDAARAAGINLQLSGHTHGGQMFPFNLLAKILYRGFSGGFYRFKDFALSVSHGVGTWGPPLRLGSRSEITLIKLLKD